MCVWYIDVIYSYIENKLIIYICFLPFKTVQYIGVRWNDKTTQTKISQSISSDQNQSIHLRALSYTMHSVVASCLVGVKPRMNVLLAQTKIYPTSSHLLRSYIKSCIIYYLFIFPLLVSFSFSFFFF